mgnify:CR=1 FL=1
MAEIMCKIPKSVIITPFPEPSSKVIYDFQILEMLKGLEDPLHKPKPIHDAIASFVLTKTLGSALSINKAVTNASAMTSALGKLGMFMFKRQKKSKQ